MEALITVIFHAGESIKEYTDSVLTLCIELINS